jgi:hypothetical protein
MENMKMMKRATVIPAYPGFNVALAWEHDGEWVSGSHPVVGWAIQDRAEPEPIAAGMPTWRTKRL